MQEILDNKQGKENNCFSSMLPNFQEVSATLYNPNSQTRYILICSSFNNCSLTGICLSTAVCLNGLSHKMRTCDLKDTQAHFWGQMNLAKEHIQVFRAAVPTHSLLFLSLSPCCKHNYSQFLWHVQPNTKHTASTSQAGLSFPVKHNSTKHRFSGHPFISSNGP